MLGQQGVTVYEVRKHRIKWDLVFLVQFLHGPEFAAAVLKRDI